MSVLDVINVVLRIQKKHIKRTKCIIAGIINSSGVDKEYYFRILCEGLSLKDKQYIYNEVFGMEEHEVFFFDIPKELKTAEILDLCNILLAKCCKNAFYLDIERYPEISSFKEDNYAFIEIGKKDD